jgi:hypothetical protein
MHMLMRWILYFCLRITCLDLGTCVYLAYFFMVHVTDVTTTEQDREGKSRCPKILIAIVYCDQLVTHMQYFHLLTVNQSS